MGGIDDDEWYQRAQNKILVLRFESPQEQPWGAQLAQLICNYTAATIQGVNSLAIFSLGHAHETVPLNPHFIATKAQHQNTPVVIWGSFYQHAGRIFVHPHISLFPKLAHQDYWQNLRLDISTWQVPKISQVEAVLPTRQINFAPIELDSDSFHHLANMQEQVFTLRASPNENADITARLDFGVPYYVLETQDAWTRFHVLNQGKGWAKVGNIFDQSQFEALKAVSLYAQGLLQFIAGNDEAVIQTFNQYLETYGDQQDALNRGTAMVVLGYSYFRLGVAQDLATVAQSEHVFRQASKLIPLNAAPTNCLALSTFWKIQQDISTSEAIRYLEQELIHIIQTTGDRTAIQNLKILYHLPRLGHAFGLQEHSIRQQAASQLSLLNQIEQQQVAQKSIAF